MIDIKILKFLYSKKHDGNYHDVSLLFNVSNHTDFFNDIENLATLESEEHSISNRKHKNKIFKTTFDKKVIDNSVIALEEYGYVVNKVEGDLPPSALSSEDDSSNANNSICKITSKGIEYYETKMQNYNSKVHSTIALIFSFIALTISILATHINKKIAFLWSGKFAAHTILHYNQNCKKALSYIHRKFNSSEKTTWQNVIIVTIKISR